jgi:hypothetical protein
MTLLINKVKRNINFKSVGKDMYDFVTTEKDIQIALEKHFGFKRMFYLVGTVELPDEKTVVLNEETIVDDDKDLIFNPIEDINNGIPFDDDTINDLNNGLSEEPALINTVKQKEKKPKQEKKSVNKKSKSNKSKK